MEIYILIMLNVSMTSGWRMNSSAFLNKEDFNKIDGKPYSIYYIIYYHIESDALLTKLCPVSIFISMKSGALNFLLSYAYNIACR